MNKLLILLLVLSGCADHVDETSYILSISANTEDKINEFKFMDEMDICVGGDDYSAHLTSSHTIKSEQFLDCVAIAYETASE